MNTLRQLTLTTMAATAMATVQADILVYDNLGTPIGNYVGGFAYDEIADDVTLSSGGIFSRATVAYAGFNFDGDETLTLNLYRMDGPPTPGSFGFNTPGTLLFSQTLPITATDGAWIDFVDLSGSVNLPTYLGIGLEFDGVDFDPQGVGSDGGPLLYHPPGLGDSLEDYWLRGFPNSGDAWALYTFGGNPPVNLGVQISVVPEASTWTAMIGFAGIAGSVAFRRYRRSQ